MSSNKPNYMTVRQFSQKNPAFSESSLRYMIFYAGERQNAKGESKCNGLLEAGAIVRIGRKVLIDEDKFLAWVQDQEKV